MYMMNTMVVRKLLDGFKHMTYKIAQQTESMSTFRNLVWHEFEIITRMSGPRFKSYNVHQIETSIKSRTMYIQMLFLAPPPWRHTYYLLHVSAYRPLLTTLGRYRFQHTFILSLHVLISKSLNYTTPFSTLLPNVFTSHTRHCTPCRALPLSLSLSPLPLTLSR